MFDFSLFFRFVWISMSFNYQISQNSIYEPLLILWTCSLPSISRHSSTTSKSIVQLPLDNLHESPLNRTRTAHMVFPSHFLCSDVSGELKTAFPNKFSPTHRLTKSNSQNEAPKNVTKQTWPSGLRDKFRSDASDQPLFPTFPHT